MLLFCVLCSNPIDIVCTGREVESDGGFDPGEAKSGGRQDEGTGVHQAVERPADALLLEEPRDRRHRRRSDHLPRRHRVSSRQGMPRRTRLRPQV